MTKSRQDDGGFTLIELLVVMIIIGILAAIAIPVFLSQRAKAQDSAAKADASTLGKELATYFVDNTAAPFLLTENMTARRYQLTATSGGAVLDLGRSSDNVDITSQGFNATTPNNKWCVGVTNAKGSQQTYKYSATSGLTPGACTSGTDY